ncbi:MAG: ComEC/Rec2 family competence protein [Patescibacteria group bacterium]
MRVRVYCAIFAVGIILGFLLPVSVLLFRTGALTLALLIALSFVATSNFRVVVFAAFFFLLGVLRGSGEIIEFRFLEPFVLLLVPIRDAFVTGLNRALPEPYGSYVAGVMVGVRSNIPREIRDAFRRTGTSHITALSGYNVTIIVEYVGRFVQYVPVALAAVWMFVLATGAASSVVRAAIMGSLVSIARAYGENYDTKNALWLAASMMIFFVPEILFNDIGFQLSVAATWGLITFVPFFDKKFAYLPRAIREALSSTLAAQIATLPLITYYFGLVSPFSIPANVFVLPTIPVLMGFGFFAGIAGYIMPYSASFIAWPVYLVAAYQLQVIQFFASIHVF